MELPGCDDLFLRFFDRWYDEEARQRKGFKATRPDMLQSEALKGTTPSEASPLVDEAAQAKVRKCIDGMVEAVRGDWPIFLAVSGDIELKWIAAFDNYYDEEKIAKVITSSDEED